MNVAAILSTKGRSVVSVGAATTVMEALKLLTERGIGALVVSERGRPVAGIVSERDVVRALASSGPPG